MSTSPGGWDNPSVDSGSIVSFMLPPIGIFHKIRKNLHTIIAISARDTKLRGAVVVIVYLLFFEEDSAANAFIDGISNTRTQS